MVKNALSRLTKSLFENGISYEEEEKSIIANGCRITFKEGYILHSLITHRRIGNKSLYSPDEVCERILSLSENLEQRIERILSDESLYKKRKKAFLRTVKNKVLINKIILCIHSGSLSLEKGTHEIQKLIAEKRWLEPRFLEKIQCYERFDTEIILPIPLDINFMLDGKVSVIDFVIHETLVSCPALSKPFSKIAQTGYCEYFPYMLAVKPAHHYSIYNEAKADIILNSPFKRRIYDAIVYLLGQERNFSYIHSNNESIWQQLSWIYAFQQRETNLLPSDFIEKIKGFSLTT